jgi:hypothetical protein
MMYPQPPAPRIAYDLNGTIGFVGRSAGPDTSPVEMTERAMQAFNADASPTLAIKGWIEAFGYYPGNIYTPYSPDVVAYWNIQSDVASTFQQPQSLQQNFVLLLLPEPTHLQALFVQAISIVNGRDAIYGYSYPVGQNAVVQVSQDTTTGLDGTWTTVRTHPIERNSWAVVDLRDNNRRSNEDTPVQPNGSLIDNIDYSAFPIRGKFRQDGTQSDDGVGWVPVYGTATRNVVAVRVQVTDWPNPRDQGYTNPANSVGLFELKLHLYGTPDSGASDDRLQFQELDGDQKYFDWGDLVQGQKKTQQFQIKNLSADKAATGVTLTISDSNNSQSPAPLDSLDLSLDGQTWYRGQIPLPDIPAGQASSPLTLRVQVPEANLLGAWSPRLTLDVEEWA